MVGEIISGLHSIISLPLDLNNINVKVNYLILKIKDTAMTNYLGMDLGGEK
jgi:hypothetical protein